MNIIENLKDPKKKSITLLLFYLIFFIFVFLVITPGERYIRKEKSIPTQNDTSVISLDNIVSYNFIFTINNNVISGTYYNKEALLYYNMNNYYIENDVLYRIDNNRYYESNIEYNIVKLLKIFDLIKTLEEYSNTNYKDGRTIITYLTSFNNFKKYYYGISDLNNSNIEINVEKNNNILNKITIDLTGKDDSLNLINLEYSNINNINSLSFNKENYIYGN